MTDTIVEMLVQNEEDISDNVKNELRQRWQAIRITPMPSIGSINFSQRDIDEIDNAANIN